MGIAGAFLTFGGDQANSNGFPLYRTKEESLPESAGRAACDVWFNAPSRPAAFDRRRQGTCTLSLVNKAR
jgi:hypothetical protein